VSDPLALLLSELELLVGPLVHAAESDAARTELFAALGWRLERLDGFPVSQLVEDAGAIAAAAEQLAQAVESPPQSLAEVEAQLDSLGSLAASLLDLSRLGGDRRLQVPPDVEQALGELGPALLQLLVVDWLWRYHPRVLQLARLLTLVRSPADQPATTEPIQGADGEAVRYPAALAEVRLDRLGPLLRDPAATLSEEYVGAGGLPDEQAARLAAGKISGRLGPLLASLGAAVDDAADTAGAAGRDPERTLAVRFDQPGAGHGERIALDPPGDLSLGRRIDGNIRRVPLHAVGDRL
jgi:hypothetical protein